MHRVDHKDGILTGVHKVQDTLSGVAAPHLNVCLQREEHIAEQALMDVRPLEFGYAERWPRRTRTEHGTG